jgi:hypothetical protein
MNREWMRQCIWVVVLGSAPLLFLFWSELSSTLKWLIPTVLLAVVVGFLWFDMVRPFAPDDPAHAELEEEMKEYEKAKRESDKRGRET